MAADMIVGYFDAPINGVEFKRSNYALDRKTRESAVRRFFATISEAPVADEKRQAA